MTPDNEDRKDKFTWRSDDIVFNIQDPEDEDEEDEDDDDDDDDDEAPPPSLAESQKKAAAPDGEIMAYDAWADYDRLKDDIGEAWLKDYQSDVLQSVLSALDENGLSIAALDKALAVDPSALITRWTGTEADPGVLSRLLMAGMAAGDASLKQGSAANPNRPVALKATLSINWTLQNQETVDFIRRYASDLIHMLDQTTAEQVRKVIAEWQMSDQPVEMLRQLLREVILDKSRVSSISETETTRAYFEGARERYKQAGVKKIEWRTVNVGLKRTIKQPGDVCDVCTPLHNKIGELGKGVWSDTLNAYVTPPAHSRCRCWVVAADEDML